MLMPKISIIMPSYNQSEYIGEAIESVLNQSYPKKELIIIDGGSTDGSVENIKRYESHLAYWVSEKDRGQSHAIRKGIAKSSGKWLNWINSDDALLPGALEAIARGANDHPDADIIVGRGMEGDEHGCFTHTIVPMNPRVWMPKHACYGRFCQQATFWTRDAYESSGGVNEKLFFRMDTDLLERMLSNGHRVIAIPNLIGFFRVYSNTKSGSRQDVRQKEFDARLHELGISKQERWIAVQLMRIYRLISGNYIRTWIASTYMRDKYLSDLWRNALATGSA